MGKLGRTVRLVSRYTDGCFFLSLRIMVLFIDANRLKIKTKAILLVCLFIAGILLCSSAGQQGPQRKIRVAVGEIKEISMPGRGDGSFELVGASDNQEVVEVSRQQLAPAVDTLKRNAGPTVFQLKGVTVGTANVVFSKKPINQMSTGEVVRTYVVQVTAK